jgi:hypothetical protein
MRKVRQVIPEGAVKAAVEAFWVTGQEPNVDRLMAALEAAAPHLMAAALNEAAEAFESLPMAEGPEISTGTWEWFELFPIQHLRDRAEDLTK